MVQADLTTLVSMHVSDPTYTEIIAALKPATEKLERIIQREGDADGARREPSYIAQLIAENIRSNRMTNKCMARYNKKKARCRSIRTINYIKYCITVAKKKQEEILLWQTKK